MKDRDNLLIQLERKNREVESLKKEIIRLREELSIDHGSGVLNRRQGVLNLNREIERFNNSVENLTIAFLDIDKLKLINDNYGHCEGDRIIRELASTVMENIREDDFIYRHGGDEFIVVFKNADLNYSKKIWNRIEEKIYERNKILNFPYDMYITAGFAEYKKDYDLNEFISYADKNMYKNKNFARDKK